MKKTLTIINLIFIIIFNTGCTSGAFINNTSNDTNEINMKKCWHSHDGYSCYKCANFFRAGYNFLKDLQVKTLEADSYNSDVQRQVNISTRHVHNNYCGCSTGGSCNYVFMKD